MVLFLFFLLRLLFNSSAQLQIILGFILSGEGDKKNYFIFLPLQELDGGTQSEQSQLASFFPVSFDLVDLISMKIIQNNLPSNLYHEIWFRLLQVVNLKHDTDTVQFLIKKKRLHILTIATLRKQTIYYKECHIPPFPTMNGLQSVTRKKNYRK